MNQAGLSFSYLDVLFIVYCLWTLLKIRNRSFGEELTQLILRLAWIFLTFHFYRRLGAPLVHTFSFLPPSALYTSSFATLMVSLGFVSSLLINAVKVFFKNESVAFPETIIVGVMALVRAGMVYSFMLFYLMLVPFSSVQRAVERSYLYSTAVKNLAPGFYVKACGVGSKLSPFFNAEQEVENYGPQRDLPADRGSGDRKGSEGKGNN